MPLEVDYFEGHFLLLMVLLLFNTKKGATRLSRSLYLFSKVYFFYYSCPGKAEFKLLAAGILLLDVGEGTKG